MIFRLFLALFLTFPTSVWAMQPNGCPDFEEPDVSVERVNVAPAVNHTLDLPSLLQIAMENGENVSGSKHDTPVGLTASSLSLATHFEVKITIRPADRMACAQISRMNMDFGFQDTVIYMARELPYNSCSYRTVMDHERRHVRVDQEMLEAYAPLMPGMLKKAIQEIGVIRASSKEAAQAQLKSVMDRYISDLGVSLSQVRQNYQTKIDTPQEYENLAKSCNGDLGEYIKKSRNLRRR